MKKIRDQKKDSKKDFISSGRMSKEIAQTVLDSIPEGILLLSRDLRILWANKKTMDLMHLDEGEVIGNFCYKVTHHRDEPCQAPNDICPVEGVLKTGKPISVIHTHFDKDNNEIYVEVSSYPVKVKKGEIDQFIHIARNVTDRVKAEKALEEAKEFTDNIIKSMIDTLIVVDPQGTIRAVNQATEKLLGYESRELIGRPVEMLLAGKEESLILKCDEQKVVFKEGEVCNYSMNYRAKNGDIIPVSFSGALMRNKEGQAVGIVGIARDMRELKRLQARLVRSEKLAAIGELAAGVAHEINNPLNVISGNAELLSMGKKDEDVKEATRIILEQVKRAATITQRLLKFSKKIEPKIERIDVNEILEDTIPLLEYQIKRQNIDIKKELGTDLLPIVADSGQLQQVFLNIMLNAVQAMPQGGTLTIRAYPATISNFGKRETDVFKLGAGMAVIEFKDTGEGIPEENLKMIFNPFFSTKEGGTGLGLSICHGIIEAHNGTIEVQSKVGRGTSFIIQLPLTVKKEIDNG